MKLKHYALSVGALIWNREGELLLLRRVQGARHFAGQWEPPGGKTINGEEVFATVVREVREETGLEIEVDAVAGAIGFELPQVRVAMLYFHVHAVTGVPRVSAEHDDLRWVNPAEINGIKLTEPFNRLVCQRNPFRRPNDDRNSSVEQLK